MSTPVDTVRVTPTGARIPEGFPAKIAFQLAPSLEVWERSLKPPGIDGGEPIDITTMHNIEWHTMFPRKLKKIMPITVPVAYNPAVLDIGAGWGIRQLINKNQSETILWPDAATLDFFGYLQKWELGDLKEGEFPEATMAIVVTNYDDLNKVEQGPVLSASTPGT